MAAAEKKVWGYGKTYTVTNGHGYNMIDIIAGNEWIVERNGMMVCLGIR